MAPADWPRVEVNDMTGNYEITFARSTWLPEHMQMVRQEVFHLRPDVAGALRKVIVTRTGDVVVEFCQHPKEPDGTAA
jgi:hypothetical protein